MARTLIAALVLSAAVLPGCTTEIAPAVPGEQAFTVWGQLDPSAPRQALRVTPITATIDEVPDFSGVTVTSFDLDTGEEVVWRDSVVNNSADVPAHVFLADYRPGYDRRIEVQIRRDGELVSYARTQTPPRVDPYFEDIRTSAVGFVDLVTIGAPRLGGAVIEYVVFPSHAPSDVTVESFRIPDRLIRSIDVGWTTRVELSQHIATVITVVDARYPMVNVRTVNTCRIQMRVAVLDPNWAAPFPLDFSRELVLEPGTVSNVRNGYGYVGGGYKVPLRLEPTDRELRQLGLQPRQRDPCLSAGY